MTYLIMTDGSLWVCRWKTRRKFAARTLLDHGLDASSSAWGLLGLQRARDDGVGHGVGCF